MSTACRSSGARGASRPAGEAVAPWRLAPRVPPEARIHRIRPLAAFALALGLTPTHAMARSCAGFTDVSAADPLVCPAVQWVRNRSITLGCGTGTTYCPSDPVTRAAMALFMNRLGVALSPQLAFAEASVGAVDPDLSPVLCQTAATAAATYPRQALVSAAFAGLATADAGFSVQPQASTDGGASWAPLGTVAIGETVVGPTWGNAGAVGTMQIPAGQAVRFAIRVSRAAGGGDFSQARCQVLANVMNANGASPPFDGVLAVR